MEDTMIESKLFLCGKNQDQVRRLAGRVFTFVMNDLCQEIIDEEFEDIQT